ncbi:MAG: endonuclease/exonuclease/phosphatase family protein [Patescibacteria group bacterium]
MSLRTMTLNIEGNKHFDRWLPVVKEKKPEVVCLQEVFEIDLPHIQQELGMQAVFAPMLRYESENKYAIPARGVWGVALLTAASLEEVRVDYYSGSEEVLSFAEPNDASRVLLSTVIHKGAQNYTVGTTHFTWSSNGEINEAQAKDIAALEKLLESYDELILCGDFNAPRGKDIHNRLAQLMQSVVPESETTTIDGEFHYAGRLQLVVDDIFLTAGYQLQSVEVIEGVSDHKAIWAEITTVA